MEYITMEQEKIEIARKGIEEDREKFEKIMNDSEKNVKITCEEVKNAHNEKLRLSRKIEELNNQINKRDITIQKMDDDLVNYKQNKHFLDILAIEAGLKKP